MINFLSMLLRHSSLRSRSGFSLVGVLVALVLLTSLGVIFTNLFLKGLKGQKKVAANFDFDTRMWEVASVLKDPEYCSSSTNLVFKESGAGGVLALARLSAEATPTTNSVTWIGYQVGSGASAQNVKVLAEGDVIENLLKISSITFVRQSDAVPNTPENGQTTHNVDLVITANPVGSGFPVSKTFQLKLITETTPTTHNIIGCSLQS